MESAKIFPTPATANSRHNCIAISYTFITNGPTHIRAKTVTGRCVNIRIMRIYITTNFEGSLDPTLETRWRTLVIHEKLNETNIFPNMYSVSLYSRIGISTIQTREIANHFFEGTIQITVEWLNVTGCAFGNEFNAKIKIARLMFLCDEPLGLWLEATTSNSEKEDKQTIYAKGNWRRATGTAINRSICR